MANDTIVRAAPPIDAAAFINALDGDRFKQFLDHIPVAVAVSELQPSEIVTYANLAFQKLTGCEASDIEGKSWRALPTIAAAFGDERSLRQGIADTSEYIGAFTIKREAVVVNVDVWSNTIENEAGTPIYRLVAMRDAGQSVDEPGGEMAAALSKDILLQELQHRVKNNLQMITALIRMEARNLPEGDTTERFARLVGRINALAVLYDALSNEVSDDQVDLGAYLGQVGSAVMQAHAVEGIRLDTRMDTWPVSINVAMPAGLVVNEVMTNSLKHGFVGREEGTITLQSLIDNHGCHITVSDNGVGLPEGTTWPHPNKLSAVIVQSLKQNAGARVSILSGPGQGVAVTISFARPSATHCAGQAVSHR